jgi:non-homologous end joining protein Ku
MEKHTNPNPTTNAQTFKTYKNIVISLDGFTTFPAQLISAASSASENLRLAVHTPDGKALPVEQFYTAGDGKYFKIGQLQRGVELADETLYPVSAAEIASTKTKGTNIVKFTQFVMLKDIPPVYFMNSYVVNANTNPKSGGNADAPNMYAVLLAALSATGRSGLGKMYDRDKEYNVVICPDVTGTKLVIYTLYTSKEVRNVNVIKPTFEITEKIQAALVKKGIALIEGAFADFDPNGITSDSDNQTAALIARKKLEAISKANGSPMPEAPVVVEVDAADAFLDSLEASVTQARDKKKVAV